VDILRKARLEMADGNTDAAPRPPSPSAAVPAPPTPETREQLAAASITVEEHPQAMLDVHPPRAAAHTWQDFLIHILTISVGLLIAIGLEQTVEYFHHRHQVAETREALRVERDENIRAFAESVREFHRQTAALINNIIVLRYIQQHPGTPEARLPGILVWHAIPGSYSDSAWKTAQQSNVTALMPQDEVRHNDVLYSHIEDVANAFPVVWPTIVRARLYGVFDPDPTHLSPAQVEDEIALTQAALVSHFSEAAVLVQLGGFDPGFSGGPTKDELNSIMHVTDTERDPNLAEAIAVTNGRLPSASQLPIPRRISGP
jgi:hypothetical protein